MSGLMLSTFAGDNARLVAALSIALRAIGIEAKIEPVVYPTMQGENGEGLCIDGYILATPAVEEVPERAGVFRVKPRTRLVWYVGYETQISGGYSDPGDTDYTEITSGGVSAQLAAKYIALALAEHRVSAAFEHQAEREMARAEELHTEATHARVNHPLCPRQSGSRACSCEELELGAAWEVESGGLTREDFVRADEEFDAARERDLSRRGRLGI
ncbi:MAG TPA: hypothetical protein VGB98_20210 [Pyrinomonadaceae bacterium]|jgi:hypothetical protein